nr:zinc finger protein OZF-like [Nerophis lumbriciformis]
MLKEFIRERLMSAADEIFRLFEGTIASYEEELSRTREANERHRQQREAVCSTQVATHVEEFNELIGCQEECPPELLEALQPPNIKKEDELCIAQEEERLLESEEAFVTKLPLTAVSVKSEDQENKPQTHNFLAPLSDSDDTMLHFPDSEDRCDTQELLSSDPDYEADMRTHMDSKQPELLKQKTGKECLTCSVCGKRFSSESYFTRHMRTHTGEKPFSCLVCSRQFSHKANMLSHMRTHTGEKPFVCSVCPKTFCKKPQLAQHMLTHTGEKPFCCSVCSERFSQKSNMVSHMRIHTGEKPFSCSYCSKRFSHKANMLSHMRTHTGEKPFSCLICGEHYTQKSNMVTHMRTHTGEKPFSCPVCGKRFSGKTNMVTHMRTHTGEKPPNCSVCGVRFSEITDMESHMRTHIGEKPFGCPICGKKFSVNATLLSHMRIHRNVGMCTEFSTFTGADQIQFM